MPVKQRPQWDAADVAAHAMEATSLSQLTLPEVKRMAAQILAERRDAPEPGRMTSEATAESNLRPISNTELEAIWAGARKFVD